MPGLDVSDALTDTQLVDSFKVLRRKQYVNRFGETKMSVEVYDTFGVVHPEGLNDLARRPEAQLNTKTIAVYTRFAIRGESCDAEDGGQYQPDLIDWANNRFLVIHVEDWSKYARGYVKVTATSQDTVDQPTTARDLAEFSE